MPIAYGISSCCSSDCISGSSRAAFLGAARLAGLLAADLLFVAREADFRELVFAFLFFAAILSPR